MFNKEELSLLKNAVAVIIYRGDSSNVDKYEQLEDKLKRYIRDMEQLEPSEN